MVNFHFFFIILFCLFFAFAIPPLPTLTNACVFFFVVVDWASPRHRAAMTLQRFVRGYLVRSRLNQFFLQEHAAMTIQRVWYDQVVLFNESNRSSSSNEKRFPLKFFYGVGLSFNFFLFNLSLL